jgi:hypothetical protein
MKISLSCVDNFNHILAPILMKDVGICFFFFGQDVGIWLMVYLYAVTKRGIAIKLL